MSRTRFPYLVALLGASSFAFVAANAYSDPAAPLRNAIALFKSSSEVPLATRGTDDSKLSLELAIAHRLAHRTRGLGSELPKGFVASSDGLVNCAVTVDSPKARAAVAGAGGTVWLSAGNLLMVSTPVANLARLAALRQVVRVEALPPGLLPPLTPGLRSAAPLPPLRGLPNGVYADFDHKGLTGKGTIVAVIDSGIDWQSRDFCNKDGSTRILALWDTFDSSWSDSHGATGSQPPVTNPDTKAPVGTLYTREQIDAALSDHGTVASRDTMGHGTACAGVAAGNGLATGNGVPAGTYQGIAPDADLLVVKAAPPDSQDGVDPLSALLGVQWVIDYGKQHHRPVVINLSFTTHNSPHDGKSAQDIILDSLVQGAGVAAVVAAGNEARELVHADGVFGPDRPGEQDVQSDPIELNVSQPALLTGFFTHSDAWALAIEGTDKFLVDSSGKPVTMFLYAEDGAMSAKATSDTAQPADLKAYLRDNAEVDAPMLRGVNTDEMEIMLQPGHYVLEGIGRTPAVTNGHFDLYIANADAASFGKGAQPAHLVGSPADSSSVIAVASYDSRRQWTNAQGDPISYNLVLGQLSPYSNPGFRRDGQVKPDIAAPGRFAISTLAPGSEIEKDEGTDNIVRDGQHIAWSGTSAAAPFVAGVVALMLEENPRLTPAKIKQILTSTAVDDDATGAIPNPDWGFGKVNPEAALLAARQTGGGGSMKPHRPEHGRKPKE